MFQTEIRVQNLSLIPVSRFRGRSVFGKWNWFVQIVNAILKLILDTDWLLKKIQVLITVGEKCSVWIIM